MKKSIINEIFNGNRGNIGTMNVPNNENRTTACDIFNQLREKLSPELLNLHQRLMDTLSSARTDETDFYFAEGFKLGLLIGIKCME